MLCEKKLQRDLVTLKMPWHFEDLKKTVPLPKSTEINFGLPKWKTLPFDSKIPKIPGIQEFVFSRRKIGESLRIPFFDRKHIDTSCPYNVETQLRYDALHDPHLTRFFRENIQLQKLMIKAGYITPELDVTCTLKEYNTYREYLREMHGKFIRKELERRDEMQKEKLLLEITEKMSKKKSEKLEKLQKLADMLEIIRQNRENLIQSILDKDKLHMKQLNALNHTRKQMNCKKKLQSEIAREYKKERLAELAKKDQQYILNLLKNIHERDHRLKLFFQETQQIKEKAKIEASINKFENKKKNQEQAMEREAQLKECAEKFKQAFLEDYEKKINKSRKKLHELFLKKRKALKFSIKRRKHPKIVTDCCCMIRKKN